MLARISSCEPFCSLSFSDVFFFLYLSAESKLFSRRFLPDDMEHHFLMSLWLVAFMIVPTHTHTHVYNSCNYLPPVPRKYHFWPMCVLEIDSPGEAVHKGSLRNLSGINSRH